MKFFLYIKSDGGVTVCDPLFVALYFNPKTEYYVIYVSKYFICAFIFWTTISYVPILIKSSYNNNMQIVIILLSQVNWEHHLAENLFGNIIRLFKHLSIM